MGFRSWSSLFTTLVLHFLNLCPGMGVGVHLFPWTGPADFGSHAFVRPIVFLLLLLLLALGGLGWEIYVSVALITCLFMSIAYLLLLPSWCFCYTWQSCSMLAHSV